MVMTVQFPLVSSPVWGIWPFLGHSAVPVPHSSLLFRDLLHLTRKFFLYNLVTVNMKQSMFKVLCFLYLKCTLTKKDIECRTCKKKVMLDIFQDWNLLLCERQASAGREWFLFTYLPETLNPQHVKNTWNLLIRNEAISFETVQEAWLDVPLKGTSMVNKCSSRYRGAVKMAHQESAYYQTWYSWSACKLSFDLHTYAVNIWNISSGISFWANAG